MTKSTREKDMTKIRSIALIPARSGSKRIKDKNIRELGGKPLIYHTIKPAVESGLFEKVVCVTDSQKYANIAQEFGAEVPAIRPKSTADDKSADIEWLKWIIELLSNKGFEYDVFSILRPTSPFRTKTTIQRAMKKLLENKKADSIRAVQKVKEHPGKMWSISGDYMNPILPYKVNGVPYHSNQMPMLPEIYVQNASLEIAWIKTVKETNSIAGQIILPFITEQLEGFDINTEEDFILAEWYSANGMGANYTE